MKKMIQILIQLVLVSLFNPQVMAKDSAEVMHWWTSAGEAKAVNVIKKAYNKTGYRWIDSSSIGGGGENLLTRLEARITTGTPPTAVQMYMGPKSWYWGDEEALANMNKIAKKEQWNQVLPPIINQMIQYEETYVSVPINIHRINWLYASSDVFKKAGAKPPETWDDFWIAAEKIKKAGFIPLALGGQDWQEATLFESVALGVGGVDFYKKAFVELDMRTLRSETMVKVFDTMRRLKQYTDKDAPGRAWDVATKMVMDGKAGMQFMGDWAAGEFLAAGKVPEKDFYCLSAPNTGHTSSFLTNVFTMFKIKGKKAKKAQEKLASVLMEPKVQEEFNLYKGSIPARVGVSPKRFNSCAQKSMKIFKEASAKNIVVPSFTYYHASDPEIRDGAVKLISLFFNSNMPAKTAVKKLAMIIRAAE